jgi:hypothetical protein
VEAKPRVLAIIDELTKMEEGLKEALREEVCRASLIRQQPCPLGHNFTSSFSEYHEIVE